MMPRLVSPHFYTDDTPAAGQWPRLARVLAYSAAQQCAGWSVEIHRVTPRVLTGEAVHAQATAGHIANTLKMLFWHELVMAAPDGAQLLLIDTDTMILRPLDEVWAQPFDYAYTVKATSRFPFNSGVVFLRVSDRVRAFVTWWRDQNVLMLSRKGAGHHQEWRRQYGGINQAALGYALKRDLTHTLHIATLPCLEWNCEDSSWDAFDPAVTRIVHCKSALRRALFGLGMPPRPKLKPLLTAWRRLERAALAAATSPAC